MKSNYVLFLVYFQTCLWLLCYFDVTIFTGNQECHFNLLYPSEGEAFVGSRGVLVHFPQKTPISGLLEILSNLENVVRLLRRFRGIALSPASPPDLGELTLERETRDSEPRDFSPPRRATNPFKVCIPIPAAEEPLKYKFGLELDWRQSCSYRKRPRGGRRCLQCQGFWVSGTAGASRSFPAGLISAGRARLGSGPERLAEHSPARSPSS